MHSRLIIIGAFVLEVIAPNAAFGTHTFCAVTEKTADGFVNLRGGPGPQYEILGRVFPSDFLGVATEPCRSDFGQTLCDLKGQWVFVEAVYRLSARNDSTLKGWIKNSLIRQIACGD